MKRIDLRLGKKLKFQDSRGKLEFIVQDAFNKYNDFSSQNNFKTRAFIRFGLDF